MKKNKIINEIINNTCELVKYKTTHNNYEEFDKAIEYVENELKSFYHKEFIINNYKNVVISNTKSKKLDIIFCCHIDVVPAERYEVIIDKNKLYGRGVFDMKGQLSVIISLLKNNKSNKKVALMITSDEEIGGLCCKEILKQYTSKLAVVPDGGNNFDLIIEEKGLMQLEISLKGKTAHASEPYNGINPIICLMDIYNKLIQYYPLPKNSSEYITSINLSKLNGGSANNMVPSNASMILDIRYTKKDNPDIIINKIKEINNLVNVNVLVKDPMFFVDEKIKVIKDFISDTENILSHKIKIKKCVATSDAIYFSEKSIPTIIINPKGNYWHGPDEYVEINSLYTLYEIMKTLI